MSLSPSTSASAGEARPSEGPPNVRPTKGSGVGFLAPVAGSQYRNVAPAEFSEQSELMQHHGPFLSLSHATSGQELLSTPSGQYELPAHVAGHTLKSGTVGLPWFLTKATVPL